VDGEIPISLRLLHGQRNSATVVETTSYSTLVLEGETVCYLWDVQITSIPKLEINKLVVKCLIFKNLTQSAFECDEMTYGYVRVKTKWVVEWYATGLD